MRHFPFVALIVLAVGCGSNGLQGIVGGSAAEESAKAYLVKNAYDRSSVIFTKVESAKAVSDRPTAVRLKGTSKVMGGKTKEFDLLLTQEKDDGVYTIIPNFLGDTWKEQLPSYLPPAEKGNPSKSH